MATTAGTSKRAWQRAERPKFDEHSRNVWRVLLTILGLVMIAIAAFAWWSSLKSPPRTLLVSITDDRKEYATVPPVPMIEQDQAALLSWARATKAPVLSQKLSNIRTIKTFCDNLFSATDGFKFESFDPLGNPSVQQEAFRKGDTLLLHIRAHGMAILTKDKPEPQPFLVKSFKDLEELTPVNSISVAELLKSLAAHEDVQIVVVLDAVHFNYDPRLGQLVNEFPTAVASAMPAGAKNLWVILPSTTGEIAVVSPEQERTLFSLALLESWQAEKSDGAGRIALPDLVQLIKDRYKELREDEDDLEFWQTVQQLPRVDAGKDARSAELNGNGVQFTTIPPAKKKDKDKEESAPADAKKTTSMFRSGIPLNPGQATVATLYQPPTDNPPATPAPPASGTPSPTPAAPATTPGTPRAASPAPMPVAPAAPVAAKPAEDAPPRHRPFLVRYSAQLETAWRLRDELENWQQSSGLQGWSPVHFAPHHWRRLNANLIAYEERCRAGTDPTTEEQLTSDLASIIGELERLKTQVQRNQPGAASDGDSFDLAKSWKAFRFGPLETPSPAWMSFQASDKNSLHDANKALKIYADAAYRLPEYVRLQGLMHSSPGVKLNLKVELTRLQDRLRVMRNRLKSRTEDWRIQPHIATELVGQARDVQAARDFLDQRIKTFAQGLSSNKSVALPGRGHAICLLLESPLLPAGERAELLDRVLPPLNPSTAKTIRRVNGGRPGNGSLILDSLLEQSRAYEQAIRFLTGEDTPKIVAKPDGTLRGSAQFCLSELTRLTSHGSDSRAETPLAIGQQYRLFLSGLPEHIKKQQETIAAMQERQRVREQFDLYHWLLLVDGRDAEHLAGVPIYLTQPFLPEPAVDAVRITVEPKQIFLSDKPQRVQVYIQLISDKVNPADLKVRLTLGDDAGGVLTIEDPEARSAAIRNREVYIGGSKEWRRTFEVRASDTMNRSSVLLTANAEFGNATAKDDAECRMKLPNEIDLKVVQLHRWTEAEPIARAETDNKHGAELRLYPNRDTTFKLMLRNLSSDDKKVRVQLIAAPLNARARLFDEKRELLPEFQALDRQIRSMKEGLPPQIAARVIAETNEKTPLALPFKNSPLKEVNLDRKLAASPAGPAAPPAPNAVPDPGVEVTSGLICVITNVDNPTERFVRWLELRPYAPHELYKVGNYTFDGTQLSFQVKLMSEDFAEGMQIEARPLTVVWDRSDKRLGAPISFPAEIQPGKLFAQLQGSIPAGLRTVILPLHIDDYPRAMIVQVKLTETGVLAENNLKQDTLAAVHIARLTHEKQMFLINKPGSPFTPVNAPEDPADWIIQTLIRTVDQPTVLIKLDKPPKQRLTFDLQADITAATFARGANIEIGLEGQDGRQLFHDRDIHVKFKSAASGGVLTLATTVDDYRNLSLAVDTDPADDTRVGLLAAIRGSSELSSTDAIHSVPIIFDRKPPEVVKASLPKRLVVGAKRELTPIVIDGQITDGKGAGLASLKVSLQSRAGAPPLGDGKPITLEVINNPGETFQVRRTIPDTWPEGVYDLEVLIEPRDLVGRVGEPLVLPLSLEIPKQREKKNLQLGGEFNKEVGKGIEEAKAQKKLQDEINKAKALQPPSGS